MRSFLIYLSFFFVIAALQSQDRSGQVWLDGGSSTNQNESSARGGYFFTDRLLVGGGFSATSRDFNVSPFVRYYLGQMDQKWRPYGEAGLEIGFDQFSINNYRFAAGLERRFGDFALFNVELEYTHLDRLNLNGYQINGNLNTIIGGPAGAEAAGERFQRGTLVVNNQLFQAGFSDSELFNGFSLGLTPEVGYFLTDRLMGKAGLNLNYGQSSFENFDPEIEASGFDLGLSVGARYYLTTGRLFNVFAETNLDYQYDYIKINDDEFTTNTLRMDLGLGASVFLNKNTSVDFGVRLDQGLINDNNLGLDAFLKLNFWFGN